MTKEEKNARKKNLAYKEFRVFSFPPKNAVLIVENIITKNATVHKNWVTLAPWEKTVAVSTAMEHLDLPVAKFECKNQKDANKSIDVAIDAAITYRVKGNEKPEKITIDDIDTEIDQDNDNILMQINKAIVNSDNENILLKPVKSIAESSIIKSKNKEIRRKWQREHGALKTFFDLNNDPKKVKLTIQNTVYDAIRTYCADKTYDELKRADFSLDDDFFINLNEKLEQYGIEITDFKFKSVNEAVTAVEEAKNRVAVAEEEAKIVNIQTAAEVDKISKIGEAEKNVDKAKLEAKRDVVAGLDSNVQAAVLGQGVNLQSVNLTVPQGILDTVKPILQPQQPQNSLYNNLEAIQARTSQPELQPQPEVVVGDNYDNNQENFNGSDYTRIQYANGEVNEIAPQHLYNMQDTSYYYMLYEDLVIKQDCVALLQRKEANFEHVPVDDYDRLNQIAFNSANGVESIDVLPTFISAQPMITTENFIMKYGEEINALTHQSSTTNEENLANTNSNNFEVLPGIPKQQDSDLFSEYKQEPVIEQQSDVNVSSNEIQQEEPDFGELFTEQLEEQEALKTSEQKEQTEEIDLNATANFDPSKFRTPNPSSLPGIDEPTETINLELVDEPKISENITTEELMSMVRDAQEKDKQNQNEPELKWDMFMKVKK